MMTLREYLQQTKTRQGDFAAAINVTQATVSRLVSGAASPSIELAYRIQAASGGEVTFEAWVAPKNLNQHNEFSHVKAKDTDAA